MCVLVFVLWRDASVYLGHFVCVERSQRDSSSTCYPSIPLFSPAPVIHLYIDLTSDKSGPLCVCVYTCVLMWELRVCFSCGTCWLNAQGGFLTHLKCFEICLQVFAALICSSQLVFRYITPPGIWRFTEIGHALTNITQQNTVCVRERECMCACRYGWHHFCYFSSSCFLPFFAPDETAVVPLPPSQRSVLAAPSDCPPASRNFCTSCFSGFGYDVCSWGERSWGPGVLELASTGPAAPLPLSLLLLIWHGESTFCSIVLSMN